MQDDCYDYIFEMFHKKVLRKMKGLSMNNLAFFAYNDLEMDFRMFLAAHLENEKDKLRCGPQMMLTHFSER